MDNKSLGLLYYANIDYKHLYDFLWKANINTYNQLVVLYDSRWQDYLNTGISTGAYIVFYQCEPIYHCTHAPVHFDQSSSESDYNSSCTE